MPAPTPFRRRLIRWLLALGLLPGVVGSLRALLRVVAANGSSAELWVPLGAGGLAWMVLFLTLPRPLWLYVVGHELTHVLWAWLFGARVREFRAGSRGGMVRLTRSNSLIALSPYFFPLYAVLWSVVFPLGARLAGVSGAAPWFLLGLGVCYAFHLTLTAHILRVRQPDLEGEGWVFSVTMILLGNGLVALIGLAVVAPRPGTLQALRWLVGDTFGVLQAAWRMVSR